MKSTKMKNFLDLQEKKQCAEFAYCNFGVLKDAGSVSAMDAGIKAEIEFTSYKRERDKNYISDFDRLAKKLLMKK